MGIKTINNAINEMENEMLQLKSQHQKDRELLEEISKWINMQAHDDLNDYRHGIRKLNDKIKKHLEGGEK